MKKKQISRWVAALVALASAGAQAQSQSQHPLNAAAQKTLNGNPEVTARFNAFRAAADAVDGARGGFLPRVDLEAGIGRTDDRFDDRDPQNQHLTRSSVALTATQMLWDGLITRNEVGRLGHEKLARYFEFVDVSEQTVLEVSRAWYDVVRYRRLVLLAEDNYVQHRYVNTQIQSRVRAGVGRGVDLEQAAARLALAEANLTTEVSNLHDVSARYQRLVGEAAPPQMTMPPALAALPASPGEAVTGALQRNAAITASIESLRAARSSTKTAEGAYQPRIEARVRSGLGRNLDGLADQRRDTTAEIVLNWNLFNGGSDQARVRQLVNVVGQAEDLRDKACRDVRQTAVIAYNDTRKLVEQLGYLDRNVLAIQKARDAYRQQFDIGQRSLLDLLNAENEVYTARRAYANAEYDLATAQARSFAAMNQLTAQLGLARIDAGDKAAEASSWSSGDDAPGRCPVLAIDASYTPKSELDQRAQRMTESAPALPVRPPAAPASAPRR